MENTQNDYYVLLQATCNSHNGCKPYRLFSKSEQMYLLSALLEYELIGQGFLEPLIHSNLVQQMVLKVITPEEYGLRHLKFVTDGEHILRLNRDVKEMNRKIRQRIEQEIDNCNCVHIANDPYLDPKSDPETPDFDDTIERSKAARAGL